MQTINFSSTTDNSVFQITFYPCLVHRGTHHTPYARHCQALPWMLSPYLLMAEQGKHHSDTIPQSKTWEISAAMVSEGLWYSELGLSYIIKG